MVASSATCHRRPPSKLRLTAPTPHRDSEIGSEAAAQLHLRGKEAMDAAFTTTCGLGRSARDCVYNRQGHLTTVPLAVFEVGRCAAACIDVIQWLREREVAATR